MWHTDGKWEGELDVQHDSQKCVQRLSKSNAIQRPILWREIVAKTTDNNLRATHLMVLTPKPAAIEDVVVEVSGKRRG
jgi:hypothetical protein